ncbi:MAG TPA: PKD domain-containing protein [Candidatus Thermoplasmatota archaeon]
MQRPIPVSAALALLLLAPLVATMPAAASPSPAPQATPVPVAVTALASLAFADSIVEVSYSPDGRYLAVAVREGPIRVLNATDHTPVVNLTTSPNWISPSSLSWGPNSDKLAAGYSGGAVAVWRIPSGTWAWTKSSLFYDVKGVSWSPDGRFLAAGIVSAVYIYWGESGALNATMQMVYGGSQPAGLSWSHDSDYIAVGQQAYAPQGALLVVFTSKTWSTALQSRWDGPLMDEVAFEGRARYLSVQLGGSRVEVWTVRNWTQHASLTTATGVEQSAWTADGSRLVMLERAPSAAPNTTEALGGFELLRIGGGTGNALSLAASPDGRRVAVGEDTGTLRILGVGADRFFSDATPLEATTGEPLTFSVRYTGPAAAAVHWRDATGARTGSAGLTLAGSSLSHTLDVPSDWDGPLLYHFEAPADGVASPERLVAVRDNDAPTVVAFNFTRAGPYGETAVGQVEFADNLEIAASTFTLAVDGVPQASASGGGTDTLNFTLSVPIAPTNSTVRLDLEAVDPTGNGGRLLAQTFALDDLVPPSFGADLSLPGTAGGRIQLGVEAADERGPPAVTLTWRELSASDESEWLSVTLGAPPVGSDDFVISVPIAEETVAVEYYFHARDRAGNTNETAVLFQPVRDVVRPEVVIDLSDRVAAQGRPFALAVIARDNVGVASVRALVQDDGGATREVDLTLDNSTGTPTWVATHDVPPSSETLTYQFVVTDEEGNSIRWGYRLLNVRDFTPPTVEVTSPTLRVLAGSDFTLALGAHDNDAIAALVLFYSRDCAGPFFPHEVPIGVQAKDVDVSVVLSDLNISTRGDGRPVCFYVVAHDVSLNAGGLGSESDPRVIEVLDGARPQAHFVTTGSPVVGRIVTFDGSLSSDDLGIVEWVWEVDGVVQGDRPVLEWRFTESGAHDVTLTVVDGAGNEATSTVSVDAIAGPSTPVGVGDVVVLALVAAGAAGGAVAFMWLRRRPPEDATDEE